MTKASFALLAPLLFAASAITAHADSRPAPQVTLAHSPNDAQMISAAASPDGVIHLLFQKNKQPFYATSTDAGKTTTAPIPVLNANPTVPGLEYLGWDMAVSDRGKVFVVTGNDAYKFKLPDNYHGMFLSMLDPGAARFGPTIALNGLPSEGFSIVAGKDGNVVVAYLRGKLYWKHSADDGKTFSPNQEIDPDYLPCNCCTTSLAYAKDGTLGLLYREAAGNRRDIWAVLLKDGKRTHVPISRTLWQLDACPMTYYKIAPAGDGFVAAWPTRGQAYFTRFSTSGKLWPAGEIKVGGKTAMRSSLFALAGKNDATLVAWKSDQTLHWKTYDQNGKLVGTEGTAPSPGPQAGGVTTPDGNFLLFP